MPKKIEFSKEDIYDILKMKEKGLSQTEIGKKVGVSHSMISKILAQYRFSGQAPQQKESAEQPATPKPEEPNKNPLSSITSRLLIKELYDRGYRIENNSLFVIEKRKVLVNDIINGE